MAARKTRAAAKKRAKSRSTTTAAAAPRPAVRNVPSAAVAQPVKGKRGRPKGSKNKPKTAPRELTYIMGPDGRPQLRGRGRPPKGAIFVTADGTPISSSAKSVSAKAAPAKAAPAKAAPARATTPAPAMASSAPAPTPAPKTAATARAASSMRATVVQTSPVTFLGNGATGNVVAGSSVYVDGRAVYADGNGLCVIPGSLIFVDSGAAPDQLGLAVTGASNAVRVAFDQAPNETNAPYKAVIANFRR